MIHGKKLVVVMPAYNAEKTLEKTYAEIPLEFVDEVILVDDASSDRTFEIATRLGIHAIVHTHNLGYGANQKTCYKEALHSGADVVVMLHADYQYTPKLLVAMASPIAIGQYHVMLGSRILCSSPLVGGMPFYKYVANRVLTLIQNFLLRAKLSEYHTGYRAFSRDVLLNLPLEENSDDFVFDNQMLAQCIYFGYSIGEISCPARYFKEASSINFRRGIVYGIGVMQTSIQFFLQKLGLRNYRIYSNDGTKTAV